MPIDDIRDIVGRAAVTRSPIILDLDGDGVETLGMGSGVYFDHDGNRFAERSGWVGKDDGLLVWDRNANGAIDDGSELFGNYSGLSNGQKAANGFRALADLDGNKDGKINASDADFANLRVWRDGNSDGVVQDGELLTLTEAGVKSLNVGYRESGSGAGGMDANGNDHRQVGSYERTDGTDSTMSDVWFKVDNAKTRERDVLKVDSSIAALPELKAAGNVRSLHQAMMRDESRRLKELVVQFGAEADRTTRQSLMNELIYRWAGVQDVDPNSRAATQIYGNAIGDARKLASLEAFLGDPYLGTWCWGTRDPNPHGSAAPILLQAYDKLVDYVYGQLMLQTHFREVIDAVRVSISEEGVASFDVSGAVALLRSAFDKDEKTGVALMSEFGAAMKTSGTYGSQLLAAVRGAGDSSASGGFAFHLSNLGFAGIVGDAGSNTLTGTDEKDERLLGMGGNDYLYGKGGDDLLDGGTGNDSLDGGQGNDVLLGGDGNDSLSGGDGNDILDGGAGNDRLYGGDGADVFRFGAGHGWDRIESGTSYPGVQRVDTAEFTAYASADVRFRRYGDSLVMRHVNGKEGLVIDYFFAETGTVSTVKELVFADGERLSLNALRDMVLVGTDWHDTIYGHDRADVIRSLAGDDVVYALGGDDDVEGGAGNDRLDGGDGNDRLDGGTGNDSLNGGRGNDVLLGGDGNDSLSGGDGNDILDGGAGNDRLYGGDGADVFRFGAGHGWDRIESGTSYPGVQRVDTAEFTAYTSADVRFRRYGDSLVMRHVNGKEGLVIDYFFAETGTVSTVKELVFADGERLSLNALRDMVLVGTDWHDTIYGHDRADVIRSLVGDDVVYALGGDDDVEGGAGNDRLDGGDGNDRLDGGTGNDSLNGGRGNDVLLGGDGNDSLSGGDGNDILDGGAGNDRLYGGDGADVFRFGAGHGWDRIESGTSYPGVQRVDTAEFTAYASADVRFRRYGDSLVMRHVNGKEGLVIDYFFAETGTVSTVKELVFADGERLSLNALRDMVLVGTDWHDTIYGHDRADVIRSLAGDDVVYALGGDDDVEGGAGNDRLDGGDGNDRLDGGTGNDSLNGGRGNDVLLGGDGNDSLSGGDGNDILDGGAGNDRLYGGDGADVFRFGAGHGWDRIESGTSYPGVQRVDTAEFTAYTSADVRFRRYGDSLVMRHVNGKEGLVIDYFFAETGTVSTVKELVFADGERLSLNALRDMVLVGTDWHDTIYGHDRADVIRSLVGDDVVYALGGDDDVEGGAGNDSVYGGDGNDRLDGGTGNDWLEGGYGNDVLLGGDGSDSLIGGDGNDTLTGGKGNDRLYGGQGADTYHFSRGDGIDTISDYDTTAGVSDTLQFGKGISSNQLWFSRSGNDLAVSILGTTDKVIIDSWFSSKSYQIEKFVAGDGKAVESGALLNLVNAMAQFSPPGAAQTSMPLSFGEPMQAAMIAAWK
ncbi:calcium-binding protein [Cupriavidus sp. SW-Y-13]|uniref:calcium-binding protein n=1 Tax=Cupriavidus sp. SW-Y-13 TaxID=2653854 RepID=UPI00136537D3|nr:calcium-binding protein [Cupriavidus sp. SW-Y-13]